MKVFHLLPIIFGIFGMSSGILLPDVMFPDLFLWYENGFHELANTRLIEILFFNSKDPYSVPLPPL